MEKKIWTRDYMLFGRSLWSSVRANFSEGLLPSPGRPNEDIRKEPLEKSDAVVPANGFRSYRVGSWFLMDCYAELCKKPVEVMEHVCGLDFGNYVMWERLNRFDLSVQNMLFVKGEASSNLASLVDIEEHGYILSGWVHSHPGKGEGSVYPSGTDIKNQKTLEAAKYSVLGAIFSQDGYIRFFADNFKFNVEVMGRGIEHVKENLYKISQA